MSLYLLDTTTVSLLMREHLGVTSRLESLPREDRVVVCTIVRGEIEYGLARLSEGTKRRRLREKATTLFAALPCEAVPPSAAEHYGRIKRDAEVRGTPLDENDLWIAATAQTLGAVVVASDTDFSHVDGLAFEDWGT